MRKTIIEQLKTIEKSENIRILHAVESGSRAWGFASPDSDYDVRFIYVRDKNYYLRLDKARDVIELPINNELDINGWDLNKTLKLLHNANPTLFEWFSSPIQYIKTDFFDKIQPYLTHYFISSKALHHYLNMAKTNYRDYLKGDMVRAKKYFYVIRPILACRWILDYNCPPPMLFSKLMNAKLPNELINPVNQLLDIKIQSPEIKEIPKIQVINEYIEVELETISNLLNSIGDKRVEDWEDLNKLFLSII